MKTNASDFVTCYHDTNVNILLDKAKHALELGFRVEVTPLSTTFMLSVYRK